MGNSLEQARHNNARLRKQIVELQGSIKVLESVALTKAERWSQALVDVALERSRQEHVEGWTPEHDDQHAKGELANAAACYALFDPEPFLADLWPWWNVYDNGDRLNRHEKAWWKPKDRRRDLVRAGALILAEIERLDRAASKVPA